ncbi:unnamed protein product, partial [Pylaiella littoralis]
MAVLMAKCERFRQAYSDYKARTFHLSTDNLSFVAGLRGRPVPAPVGRPKVRRRPKLEDIEDGENDDNDGNFSDSSENTPGAKQACPTRSCAPRAEILEAMMQKRVAAQTARHKAQSKLGSARERSQEAETKLEEAKAELIDISKAITEGDERTEALRDALRNEGSINKGFAEELDTLLAEATNLRRKCTVDTLPPRPTTPIVPPNEDDEEDDPSAFHEDGRTLECPITAPGQQPLGQQQKQSTRQGTSGPHSGDREWAHSGHLGNPGIFIRPPRPRTSTGSNNRNGTPDDDHHHPSFRKKGRHDQHHGSSSGGTLNPTSALHAGGGETGDDVTVGGIGVGGVSDSCDGGSNKILSSKAEDAWSCCGKTFTSAGRGCEPVEPLATPVDLLLDTIDPRSRLGQPLDFREFLPRTAWMGMTPGPAHPFASSPTEGTLRPHTAPERLMGTAAGQWNPQGGVAGGGGGGGGEYQRRAARSRNGGLVGGVWASGGRRNRGGAGRGTGGSCGGLGSGVPPPSPSPDSGVNAWWRTGTPQEWGGASGGGVGSGDGGGGGSRLVTFPKRHEFLRRSHPNATTATYARSSRPISAHKNGGTTTTGRLPRTDGGAGSEGGVSASAAAAATTADSAAAAAAAAAAGIDAFWPRIQILGMNGGRLPREVRQVPVDRPLTAPCGKVGRRRVRAHSSGGGG